MKTVEFNDLEYRNIKNRCTEIFKMLMDEDYHEYSESIDEDTKEIYAEIGEYLFYAVIGHDKAKQIEDHHYVPEPEPEPLPIPNLDTGEEVHYCRRCEKPTLYVVKEDVIETEYEEGEEPIKLPHLECSKCGGRRLSMLGVQRPTYEMLQAMKQSDNNGSE